MPNKREVIAKILLDELKIAKGTSSLLSIADKILEALEKEEEIKCLCDTCVSNCKATHKNRTRCPLYEPKREPKYFSTYEELNNWHEQLAGKPQPKKIEDVPVWAVDIFNVLMKEFP